MTFAKKLILGTAGHIDHGKTSLIKTLTGVNTDRLKEEQRRGITIELGFAALDLPSGFHLGIVDVPGHEKFVKNMVAGATGIDLVAMIIAADEGVMPQTREHLEICALLGIRYGLVVLTKIDLVDEEMRELASEDIREFTAGTFLEDRPVVPVSSATGDGVPELVAALEALCAEIPERPPTGMFRLPIDRVFTMKGFGTVITGTLASGSVRTGDTIMIYPSEITAKIRGLQVHAQSVEAAESGMRTAINFQGLEKSAIQRGEVIAYPGALHPSYMLDVRLTYLSSNRKPLKSRARVRFHAGTSEVMATLVLLGREEAAPGETVYAQLRLEDPVSLLKDDRFVVRSYSPVRTIGGGSVLNPIPRKHKPSDAKVPEILKLGEERPPEDVVSQHIDDGGYEGCAFSDLRIMTNLPEKELEAAVQKLLSKRRIAQVDKEKRIFMHETALGRIREDILEIAGDFHARNPLKPGMAKEELRSKLPSHVPDKGVRWVIDRMIQENALTREGELVRLPAHNVSLAADETELTRKIVAIYAEGGLTPPYFKTVCESLSVDSARAKDILGLLVGKGRIIKVKEDLYFHEEAIETLQNRVVAFLDANGEMSTPQFKEMTGVSRKYLIPLIEYFDEIRLTIRIGEIRRLRRRS